MSQHDQYVDRVRDRAIIYFMTLLFALVAGALGLNWWLIGLSVLGGAFCGAWLASAVEDKSRKECK